MAHAMSHDSRLGQFLRTIGDIFRQLYNEPPGC